MLRKIVKVVGLLFVCALVIGLLNDYWWRCSSDGLSREDALKFANEKLSIQEKKYSTTEFTLKSAQKDGSDWTFVYSAKDCTIDIIINKCGVADVGGLTRGCF